MNTIILIALCGAVVSLFLNIFILFYIVRMWKMDAQQAKGRDVQFMFLSSLINALAKVIFTPEQFDRYVKQEREYRERELASLRKQYSESRAGVWVSPEERFNI